MLINHLSTAPKDSAIQIEKESLPSSSLPTILLVYSPCLHQDMAALSTQLQNLTGLKVSEKIHSIWILYVKLVSLFLFLVVQLSL